MKNKTNISMQNKIEELEYKLNRHMLDTCYKELLVRHQNKFKKLQENFIHELARDILSRTPSKALSNTYEFAKKLAEDEYNSMLVDNRVRGQIG